ncbi:MAG: FAD-dependent oxidoreductase [Chloroflexota bacterium]
MVSGKHVVVIGGGAAGCAAAYYLARAGARVTLVERERIGSQASGWSAGGVNPISGVPAPLRALAMASYRLHRELWPEIERGQAVSRPGRSTAMLFLAETEAELADLRALNADFNAAQSFRSELLDADGVQRVEPRLRPGFLGAALTHGNAVVESYDFTRLLGEAAERAGTTCLKGTAGALSVSGHAVTSVDVDGQPLACDAVVVANGPWARQLGATFGHDLQVAPLKGEILRTTTPFEAPPFDVVATGISLFTRGQREVWLASTQQRAGFDTKPSRWGRETLWSAATALMPCIAEATVFRQTACLRPSTPDDLPILGLLPGSTNAYAATGGGTKGILLAPAMGKAIADLITTGATPLPLAGFSADRFNHTS